MTPETLDTYFADINTRLLQAQYDDRTLWPQLMQTALSELGKAATNEALPGLSSWASRVLEHMWHRAVTGVPFGEPREYPWETVLSGDGDLG